MSSGSEAVEILADAMGIAPVTVRIHSRALREHEPPLWVRAGSGRRNVQVEVSHLVNLVIAAATGFPADAAANVQRYRALTAEGGIEFGHYLGNLVDRLTLDLDASVRASLGEDKFYVDLLLGEAPRAGVRLAGDDDAGFNLVFLPPQDDLMLKQLEIPKTRLIARVTITLELLDVLARLWRDSIAHGAGTSPLPSPAAAPASANSENENGAAPTSPARGRGTDAS